MNHLFFPEPCDDQNNDRHDDDDDEDIQNIDWIVHVLKRRLEEVLDQECEPIDDDEKASHDEDCEQHFFVRFFLISHWYLRIVCCFL